MNSENLNIYPGLDFSVNEFQKSNFMFFFFSSARLDFFKTRTFLLTVSMFIEFLYTMMCLFSLMLLLSYPAYNYMLLMLPMMASPTRWT